MQGEPGAKPATTESSGSHIASVLSLALALRAAIVALVVVKYPHDWFFSKAPDLGYLTQSLVAGHGFSSPFGGQTGPTAFLAPGYPVLMAAIFRVLGSFTLASAIAIMLLETGFALATIWLMMRVAREVFGARTANLAGLVWALSPTLIWLPAIFWETSLSVLLMTGGLALALHCARNTSSRTWMLAGAYCGLATLVNPSLVVALAAMMIWAVWHAAGKRMKHAALGLTVFLLVLAPWPVRNWQALHAFIPLRPNLGYELWQGNHNGATGRFDDQIEPLNNRHEYGEYAAQGETAYMRSKSALAKAWIAGHPAEFARLTAKRAWWFWTGQGSGLDSGAVTLYASLTTALAFLGLGLLLRRSRARGVLFLLPLAVFPLPYYITHAQFRFHVLIDPLLVMLACSVVAALYERMKTPVTDASPMDVSDTAAALRTT
jgi:4-amino-4-deoxy-L-arabinose transferase-like glycosyltransferase